MGVLTVLLEKVTGLVDEDKRGMMDLTIQSLFDKSDPYVKLNLEQDNRFIDHNYGTQKSTLKKDSHNPRFDETFTWEGVKSLENMKLHVTVLDHDEGMGTLNDDTLGDCTIELEGLGLSDTPFDCDRVIQKKEKETWFSKHAKVHLKISWTE